MEKIHMRRSVLLLHYQAHQFSDKRQYEQQCRKCDCPREKPRYEPDAEDPVDAERMHRRYGADDERHEHAQKERHHDPMHFRRQFFHFEPPKGTAFF